MRVNHPTSAEVLLEPAFDVRPPQLDRHARAVAQPALCTWAMHPDANGTLSTLHASRAESPLGQGRGSG